MKKFICLFLCIALCGCFIGCSEKTEEITLSRENVSEHVSIELSFGEVNVAANESPVRSEKYYLTCLATISVKPKGDYDFTDASVLCVLDEGGRWTPVKTNEKTTAFDTAYDWDGNIPLDKEGYGETTVSLYCYSNTYEAVHPSSQKWECYAIGASGTVIQK